MLRLFKRPFGLGAIFVVFCLSLLKINAYGQDLDGKVFESTSHDFGDVLKGEIPEYRFKFVNSLDETLHIRSVKSSCGCAEASTSQETFEPGEKGEIICRYNTPTAKFSGKKDASIIVLFDQPRLVEQQLTVKGNIITGISFEPKKIDFGQIVEGEFRPIKVQLTSIENPNFRIKKIRNGGHVDVQAKETKRTENGIVRYELTATLSSSAPKGYFQGAIYCDFELGVQPNGVPKVQTLPLLYTGKLISSLQVSVDTLNFGRMNPGEVAKRRLVLASPKPFKISKVVKDKGFSVSTKSIQSKKTHIIEVTYEVGDKRGKQESQLKFLVEYPSSRSPAQIVPQTNSAMVRAVVQIDDPNMSPSDQ